MEIKKLHYAPLLLASGVRANPYFLISGVMMTKFLIASLFVISASSAFASESVPVLEKQSCEKPAYPKASLMNEESGTVVFSVLVGPDGAVMDSKVDKSSGSKTLDKAALKTYTACKFKPATKDGKPQQAWTKIEYVWSLT
ncbi:energy transducer TonB [Undibacterium sp. Rencai35W]